jgi:methylated-DNA-[protein]-cysteine S-methyltransferase
VTCHDEGTVFEPTEIQPMPIDEFFIERLSTPPGTLLVLSDNRDRVLAIDWHDHEARMLELLRRLHGVATAALRERPDRSSGRRALEAYFDGDLHAIDGLAVHMGGTPFQQVVWTALRQIRVGQTLSYSALAGRIGRPAAVRAVGLANGANPIGIVVPCHRVIGADGSLVGYGGGLERKRWLLEHEGVPLLAARPTGARRALMMPGAPPKLW